MPVRSTKHHMKTMPGYGCGDGYGGMFPQLFGPGKDRSRRQELGAAASEELGKAAAGVKLSAEQAQSRLLGYLETPPANEIQASQMVAIAYGLAAQQSNKQESLADYTFLYGKGQYYNTWANGYELARKGGGGALLDAGKTYTPIEIGKTLQDAARNLNGSYPYTAPMASVLMAVGSNVYAIEEANKNTGNPPGIQPFKDQGGDILKWTILIGGTIISATVFSALYRRYRK